VEQGAWLLPPLLVPPPRTCLLARHQRLLRVERRRGGAKWLCRLWGGECIGWTQTVWLSPEEPASMSRLLNALMQDVGRGDLLPHRHLDNKHKNHKTTNTTITRQLDNKHNNHKTPPSSRCPKKSDATAGGRGPELPPRGVQAAPPTVTSGGPECNGVGSTATYPQVAPYKPPSKR
jgi:hypothetical protein